MVKNKRNTLIILLVLVLALTACGGNKAQEEEAKEPVEIEENKEEPKEETEEESSDSRIIIDGSGREVEVPESLESIICSGVGALRYTSFMESQDLVIGVEDYELEQAHVRPYNYVNHELFKDLPVIGSNGELYLEEAVAVDPDVIIMTGQEASAADEIQTKTGIPVVLIPGSDKMMDVNAYKTLEIMGQLYKKEDRAKELMDYMDEIKNDLEERTGHIPEEDKPSVYIGGVNFRGYHGLDGTEANIGTLKWINAKNLADETGEDGFFNVELEKILAWNPDILLIELNGLPLINEDYAENEDFYEQIKAVQEDNIYSQISFRNYAVNLDMALINTYYAGSVIFPDEFSDIDPKEKADEIFNKFIGADFYHVLEENGDSFGPIKLGQD